MTTLPSLNREQVAKAFACNHAERGRLLRERRAPMPSRLDGAILWHADEVAEATPEVQKILTRRRTK